MSQTSILIGFLVSWGVGLLGQSRQALDHFEAGDYSRAAQLLEEEISAGRVSGSSFLFLGASYLNLGQPARALPHLQDASRRLPENAEVWFNLGLCNYRLRSFDRAARSLEKSLSLRADQPDAYKLLGRIHVVNESPASAERAFIRAMQLWPGDSEAVYLLGRLYQSIGRLEEAARAFERVLELAPDSVRALAYLGTVYFGLGRDSEAAEVFERSVAANSDNSKPDFVPHLEYGIYLQRMDRLEQSVAQLQQAARLGPTNVEVWLELGRSLYRLNRLDEASRALRKAAELDPEDSRPHYLLARICYERGDKRCGDRHANRAEWTRDGETQ